MVVKCTKCGEYKEQDCFHRQASMKSGYKPSCKECCTKYWKENIKGKKEYYYPIPHYKSRRAERVLWLQSLKAGQPCADCGESYEPWCMDYDHVRGVKLKSVSRLVLENAPTSRILEEIAKCELVCVLCHNKRTFERREPSIRDKYSSRNIAIINRSKDKPCYICGKKYESYNMQFDHIDNANKFRDICRLKRFTVDTLMKEIEKCQVICALCHRRKSIQEQKEKKYKPIPDPPKIKRYKGEAEAECWVCHKILPYEKFQRKRDSYCTECTNKKKRDRRAQLKQQNS